MQKELVTGGISTEHLAQILKSYKAIKRSLQNSRASTAPQTQKDVIEIEKLVGQYLHTNDNKDFLQYDNLSPINRMLIFCSEKAALFLAKCLLLTSCNCT